MCATKDASARYASNAVSLVSAAREKTTRRRAKDTGASCPIPEGVVECPSPRGEDDGAMRPLASTVPYASRTCDQVGWARRDMPIRRWAVSRLDEVLAHKEPEERGSLRSPSAVNHTVAAKGNLPLAPRPTLCPPYTCGAFLARYARSVAPKRSPRAATMLACTASTSPSVRVRSPD